MAKHWIQASGVAQNKGGLHRALHVPTSKPIPARKLSAALHSSNPHVRHMAQFDENVSHKGHKAGRKHVRRLFARG